MPKYAELPAFRKPNFITEADGDMLHREARALAIQHIEESARTESVFENVLYWRDKLDENRERRERDHETRRSTVPPEWGADADLSGILRELSFFLYYVDYDTIDEQTRSLYRQDISAFGGISPTYRIALEKDSPVIVWDFHSLLIMVQMCFSFMLTDKITNPDCNLMIFN